MQLAALVILVAGIAGIAYSSVLSERESRCGELVTAFTCVTVIDSVWLAGVAPQMALTFWLVTDACKGPT